MPLAIPLAGAGLGPFQRQLHIRFGFPFDDPQIGGTGELGTHFERQGGAAGLQDAGATYDNALSVYTRDYTPDQWATTTENISIAQLAIGRIAIGDESRDTLESALVSVDAALSVYRTGGMDF